MGEVGSEAVVSIRPEKSQGPRLTTGHLDLLDGLRGIAILYVVCFHIWQITWLDHRFSFFGINIDLNFLSCTGYLGVEVFFFVSGFCLLLPFSRNHFFKTPLDTLKSFYFKRIIKICPSYWLCLLIVLGFTDHEMMGGFWHWFRHVFTHLTFTHIWFQDTWGSINGVLWSLGIEVQFYLLFPFMARMFVKRPLIVFFAMFILSNVYRFYLLRGLRPFQNITLNQLPAYFDIFGFGMLAAYCVPKIKVPMFRFRFVWTLTALLTLTGLLFLVHSAFVIRYEKDGIEIWKAEHRSVLGLGLLVLAISSSVSISGWRKILSNLVFKVCSKVSYNWYLWHQLVALKLLKLPWFVAKTSDPHDDPVWQFQYYCVSIFLTFALAWLLTTYFELPILNYFKRKKMDPPSTLAAPQTRVA